MNCRGRKEGRGESYCKRSARLPKCNKFRSDGTWDFACFKDETFTGETLPTKPYPLAAPPPFAYIYGDISSLLTDQALVVVRGGGVAECRTLHGDEHEGDGQGEDDGDLHAAVASGLGKFAFLYGL